MTESRTWESLKEDQTVGPINFSVSEEAVRNYCAALRTDASTYLEPDDGSAPHAPVMMFATAYVRLLSPYLELGYGLMSRQTTEAVAMIPIGSEVALSGQVVEKFERKGRHYWTLDYIVRDAEGKLYVRQRVTCSVD